MATSQKKLMAKARGFTIAIEKMSDGERNRLPSRKFGEDYNRLRNATLELLPELNPIIPPEVSYRSGGEYSDTWFSEINAFCEQIYQLVSECADSENGAKSGD